MLDFPLVLVALVITFYWGRVGAMVLRSRRDRNDLAGLVPEQRRERLTWLVWVPLIVAWIALPWSAIGARSPLFAVPEFAADARYAALRWIAALAAGIALALTMRCWNRMGSDWRMDVSEKNKSALITDGLYARVRHPIYALSILLMLCTLAILPTPAMLAVGLVHIALMVMKARNEEHHLLALHGERYARYLARTGRFVPRRNAAR